MQKIMLFGNKFEINQSYIKLLLTIFSVAVLAKGAIIFRGFAIDDYFFMDGVSTNTFNLVISQGRYILAGILWSVDSLGININDMYFPLGLASLFLYSMLVLSILRFVGLHNMPASALVGSIIVAHPYFTDILAFRMALPGLSLAMIFSIIAFEMLIISATTLITRAFALLATLAMLFTYQVFLNYFSVAIIFAFLVSLTFRNKDQLLVTHNIYHQRAITLTVISIVSVITYLLGTFLVKSLGLTRSVSRGHFISFNDIPERITQIQLTLSNIYWNSEPFFSGWLKVLVTLMMGLSIIIFFRYLYISKTERNIIKDTLLSFCAFLLLIVATIGVVLPLQDWWPVPRVIAQVSIIVGLTFLLADLCMRSFESYIFKSLVFITRVITLIGLILLSNQILADQQRINQWDQMMANRMISRLEMLPNFDNIQWVHISGGTWNYPAQLKSAQGDANVSALYTGSKVALLSEVSGYKFQKAKDNYKSVGEAYCSVKQPWPHAESITINDHLAIICLKK